jgi:pimeloyl-ACP methyl ester carboxylesterase
MKIPAAAVSICLFFGVQSVAPAAPGDEIYARPGQLVPAQATRLNFYCMGKGSPTVVFDSGWGDWAPVWMIVQPQVAKRTRACSYDRAGAGFSDPGPLPRTSVRIAAELRSALHNAGIQGPLSWSGMLSAAIMYAPLRRATQQRWRASCWSKQTSSAAPKSAGGMLN